MRIISILSVVLGMILGTQAVTTIDPVNKFAYGANVGWMDFRGDTNNGVVIGEYVCSGYLYSANVGWINLGNGAPVNRIQYQNNATNDFGVNQDGLGNLRGYAYGANIGWINFEANGAPRVDLLTGKMSGSVYSANAGWISLSNTFAFVQTDTISPGLLDTNGIPFAWEYQHFGAPGVNPNADPDHDGMSNLQEYLAGTDPNNAADNLKITSIKTTNGADVTLTWTSHPTRNYFIQKSPNLKPLASWTDSGVGLIPSSAGTTTSRSIIDSSVRARFYRVEAVRPLEP